MGDKLLVRSYNVGCGDCSYLRIPNAEGHFHVLIDCGSKESAASGILERVIRDLADHMLPEEGGKKRLDLVVVTHRHEDHIKGFDPTYFRDITIGNIWITAAMNELHPKAKRSRELHALAVEEMTALADSGAALSPELEELVALYGINNTGATTALTRTLPEANGIQPSFVHAGKTSADYGISIADTTIHVLAPELDIDHFYLGAEADATLRGVQAGAVYFRKCADSEADEHPTNISSADFRRLKTRLLSNGLAFAVDDSKIQNNVSTVLLVEWRGRRLLFVGDAEWEEKYQEGRKNGSWNVMWHRRRELLGKPLDFLKVGHHGSLNATPWNRDGDEEHEVNQILAAILPLPAPGESPLARCVVSTKRKQYSTIPDAKLLTELGRRVSNTKRYLKELQATDPGFDPKQAIFNYSVLKKYSKEPLPREVGDKGFLHLPQPPRTDLESAGRGREEMLKTVEFVDVEIEPAGDWKPASLRP